LTKALAAELVERRIQVNAIIGRSVRDSGAFQAGFDDVVRTAVFLCAVQGTFVTGETIDVGGTAPA
jgi:NAD(P)-dependent dehydrogenase (short-subunit alcohol dehydrogenase family)